MSFTNPPKRRTEEEKLETLYQQFKVARNRGHTQVLLDNADYPNASTFIHSIKAVGRLKGPDGISFEKRWQQEQGGS